MAIVRLKTVYVASEDATASGGFYRDALGLPLRFADGERWVQFKLGDVAVAAASLEESAVAAPAWAPVFEAETEADHATILAGGGRLIGDRDMGDHGRTRTYADPAGAVFQCWWPAGALA